MKINIKLIPIKIHYFCFLGSVSPIFPFMIVVGQQLGIPVSVIGSLSAVSLLSVVLMKPIFAALADAYPSYRRLIFLLTLTIMTVSLSSIVFITPMREDFTVEGQVIRAIDRGKVEKAMPKPAGEDGMEENVLGKLVLQTQDDGRCFVTVAWDCLARCSQPWACINDTTSSHNSIFPNTIKITALGNYSKFEVLSGEEGLIAPGGSEHSGLPMWGVARDHGEVVSKERIYRLEGVNFSTDLLMTNISLECDGGQWEGKECQSVWEYWQFWGFTALLIIGTIAFAIAVSVTDAIIVDTIGKDGDYGVQRAWGTVGWGMMGPVAGFLIDWWSGTSITKNYAPAFLLSFILASLDVLVSATTIKVPKIETETNLLSKVWPLLKKPRFFIFCFFVLFNGAFDGLAASFIFIMQEDMVRGTSAMNYIKLLQGFTLFVQCGIEAPFMFINKWFMTRLGAHYVTSLVFFLYIFRLLGLCLAGAYWPVWMTLVVEVLNGPCYGLGYTAIVVYSSQISPPGTSNTVQSLTNLFYENLGYAVAMFAGGLLYSSLGGPGMYLVSGLTAVVIFILHLISLHVLPPIPEENTKEVLSSSSKEEDETEKMQLDTEREAILENEENALRGSDEEVESTEREKEV